MLKNMNSRWIVGALAFSGAVILLGLLVANDRSHWIENNGGLPAWLQAIGSLYAIVAISIPVLLERSLVVERARKTVLSSARMATNLMNTVATNAFDENAHFSEWWVPQWHIIDEVCASCPVHDIDSPNAMEAFVTIRELYGRLRGWDQADADRSDSMQSYVMNLCMNANMNMTKLENELS